MSAAASHDGSKPAKPSVLPFVVVAGLTAAELAVAAAGGNRAARVAGLVCLLVAKIGVVLSWFMGARGSRRAARLVLVALVFAAGFAAALMADTAARARVG